MNFKSRFFEKKKKPITGVNHRATMRGVEPIYNPHTNQWWVIRFVNWLEKKFSARKKAVA